MEFKGISIALAKWKPTFLSFLRVRFFFLYRKSKLNKKFCKKIYICCQISEKFQKQRSARSVFKVRDRDRDWAGTVSTSETETKTEEIQSQQARPRLLFTNIRDWDRDPENMYFRDWDRDRDQENGRDRDWDRDSCWSFCSFYIQFGPILNF